MRASRKSVLPVALAGKREVDAAGADSIVRSIEPSASWPMVANGLDWFALVPGDISAAWRDGGFVGNWFVELTPEEAGSLTERIFALLQELRVRPAPTPGAERALVSITLLPWLEPS